MVHLPERMAEILRSYGGRRTGAQTAAAGLSRHRTRSQISRLLKACVAERAGLDVLPPLFVYDPDGNYSREIMAYYRHESPLGG